MDKEILKPFDLSGTFDVNNVHPDAPRDERPDSSCLTNPARSAHRASSALSLSLNTREDQPHIKVDKSPDKTIAQMCAYLSCRA